MDLVRLRAAAHQLGVSYPTLKQWIYRKRIRSVKTAGGHHRIPESEINRLLFQNAGVARPKRFAAAGNSFGAGGLGNAGRRTEVTQRGEPGGQLRSGVVACALVARSEADMEITDSRSQKHSMRRREFITRSAVVTAGLSVTDVLYGLALR